MDKLDLREAQAKFVTQIKRIKDAKKELYKLQKQFVKYFSPYRILNMDYSDYVLGMEKPDVGFNFCYALETQLKGLGWMIGGSSFKFGIYYGKTKSDSTIKFRFPKNKFGHNESIVFKSVKESIEELLVAGKRENLNTIDNNLISPMFKGKILATYFPELYLNIFSVNHLDYFLQHMNLDDKETMCKGEVFKRKVLLDFKNNDAVMKKWDIDIYADFLYQFYGHPTHAGNVGGLLTGFGLPRFARDPVPEFINMEITIPKISSMQKSERMPSGKTDFEKKARMQRRLGDRGEKMVFDLEKKRLTDLNKVHLAKRVKQVSEETDGLGYDVLSFDKDGTQRFIEVKATDAIAGDANFFISANEIAKANKLKNYYIYIVYEITSKSPKVWALKNPFKPENKKVVKTPIQYRVSINVK